MRIFYELRYPGIIETVWTFYLKSVPAKFQKYLKHISWVISGTSSSKLSCNPCHPSRNISCNHRHHLLQPSWRQIFSISNNQKTRVDSDINSDYKAPSFDKLYIRHRKWDTAGFVRAHQRKYWNALTVAAAMLMMVAAATIVRFPPVIIVVKFVHSLDNNRINVNCNITWMVTCIFALDFIYVHRISLAQCVIIIPFLNIYTEYQQIDIHNYTRSLWKNFSRALPLHSYHSRGAESPFSRSDQKGSHRTPAWKLILAKCLISDLAI